MRRLHLATLHENVARFPDQGLRDIDAIAAALREAKRDRNIVLSGRILDLLELWRVDWKTVLDVLYAELEVNRTGPGRTDVGSAEARDMLYFMRTRTRSMLDSQE